MFSKSCIYIGLLLKQIRDHYSLSPNSFISDIGLNLTPELLSNIEKGLLDLHIDDFIKIIRHFDLDLNKVFEFVSDCHKNNKFNFINLEYLTNVVSD